jgi:hypothetical protein
MLTDILEAESINSRTLTLNLIKVDTARPSSKNTWTLRDAPRMQGIMMHHYPQVSSPLQTIAHHLKWKVKNYPRASTSTLHHVLGL